MERLRELPLAEIERRLRELPRGSRARQRWIEALRTDGRRGAAELAARLERALERERRERRRLARLLALRERLRRSGAERVAGVDEAGVGPLAGPLVAAAVILPERVALQGLDDSKRLSPEARERLAQAIRAQAVAWAVAEVDPEEIERLNVYRAGLEAMRRAVLALDPAPDHVLVDARTIPEVAVPQTALVRGDSRDASIAAASILAKVHRDAIMRRLDREHPGYGFARHMGYATREHLEALRRLGPSPVHRRGFAPVAQLALL